MASNENDVEEVIQCNGLDTLKKLITNPNIDGSILKEGCWAISNITAGPENHIEKILENGIIRILCDFIVASSLNYSVKSKNNFNLG